MLEFLVIEEYNKIKGKGKEFINYEQFDKLYQDAMSTQINF